jgi:hypothetical protein
MINIKDIFNSWTKMVNPNEVELLRAKDRLDVCLGCEFKKQLLKNKEWSLYCGECGCPLEGKIYSSVINPCPKNKWEDVDKKYLSNNTYKNKSTLL